MEGWRERGHRWVGLRHVPHVPSGDGDTDLDRLPSCGGSARPFHRCCVRMRMSEGRVGGHLLELGGPRTRLEAGIQGHQGPLSPRIDDHIGMSGPGMPFPSIAGLVMSIAISHNLTSTSTSACCRRGPCWSTVGLSPARRKAEASIRTRHGETSDGGPLGGGLLGRVSVDSSHFHGRYLCNVLGQCWTIKVPNPAWKGKSMGR